jgi:hypothetical protein
VVHGEEESAFALADGLRSEAGYEQVEVPDLHQSFSL